MSFVRVGAFAMTLVKLLKWQAIDACRFYDNSITTIEKQQRKDITSYHKEEIQF